MQKRGLAVLFMPAERRGRGKGKKKMSICRRDHVLGEKGEKCKVAENKGKKGIGRWLGGGRGEKGEKKVPSPARIREKKDKTIAKNRKGGNPFSLSTLPWRGEKKEGAFCHTLSANRRKGESEGGAHGEPETPK